MPDHGYTPPRPTRRATAADTALADMTAFCGADGYSVTGAPIAAPPHSLDKRYGLDPAVARERRERLPGTRLRGTTPDPLEVPGAKSGRQSDILYEGRVFPVHSNFTDEQRRETHARLLADALAIPGELLYEGANGRLTQHGNKHVMTRLCRSCGVEYSRWRYKTQRQKWGWNCSDNCRREYKRKADRDRMRLKRSRRVS